MKNFCHAFVRTWVCLSLLNPSNSFAQTTWTNLSETQNRSAICYGNSIFAAAGNDGKISTSPDGITWTSRESGVAADLARIKYVNGLFIAVGDGGTIVTSANGLTWTAGTSNTTNTLYGIFYANNTFVAVGDHIILTSPNGTSWTANASVPNEIVLDVAYGNAQFVATCFSGAILTSATATSWQTQTSGTTNFLYAVEFQNNLFVAAGNAGTVVTSSNGTTWTTRVSGSTSGIFSLTFGSGKFLAGCLDGNILSSSDGMTWTSQASGITNPVYGLTYGSSFFIGVSLNGVSIKSSNGAAWTVHNSGFSMAGKTAYDLVYNGRFTGLTNAGMIASVDGINWTSETGYDNSFVGAITYNSANRLYAVTATGNVLESAATPQWNATHINISGQALYDVTFGNGRFVAGGGFGSSYTSVDGADWTAGNLPAGTLANLTEIEYLNGSFVGIASYSSPSLIVSSSNGTTWTIQANISSDLTGLAYGKGLYVTVGNQGQIYTSADLTNWTLRTSGTSQFLRSVCFGYGSFAAVGDNGAMVTSMDGIIWQTQNSHTTNNLQKIVAAANSFVAVGSGVLLQAPADNTLPVILVSFNAQKEGKTARLNWITSMESNSDRFEVQRSDDAIQWHKAGEVKAIQESAKITSYHFEDKSPAYGQNLYRLKLIDQDDSFAYSTIRSLTFEFIEDINIYPNPATDKVFVSDSKSGRPQSVEIITPEGKTLGFFKIMQSGEINLKGLQAGLYLLRFENEGQQLVTKKLAIR